VCSASTGRTEWEHFFSRASPSLELRSGSAACSQSHPGWVLQHRPISLAGFGRRRSSLAPFCQGIGTFGDVAGLLAIFVDHAGAMVVAGPSVAGAVIGLVLVLRPDPADHGLRGLGVAFILGLGTLGIVVGILAVMVGAGAAVGGVGVLTLAGIVALIACVSIVLRGGQALERVSRGGAPPNQATAWALKAVLPFYLVGVLAVLFRSGRRARALTSASHSFYSSEIAAPGASPLGSLPLGQ